MEGVKARTFRETAADAQFPAERSITLAGIRNQFGPGASIRGRPDKILRKILFVLEGRTEHASNDRPMLADPRLGDNTGIGAAAVLGRPILPEIVAAGRLRWHE